MSMKSQEHTRAFELLAFLFLTVAVGAVDYFDVANISLDTLIFFKSIALDTYTIDFITSLWRERLTDEYDELKNNYKVIIDSFSNLMHKTGIDNPIQIFAAFVYLYRNNYLSYGCEINYSNNLKDIPGLQGIDVIRGNVVCRSLANMLNDIYNYMGYQAKTIPVRATDEFLDKGISLASTPLLNDEKNKTLELPFGANHLINMVKDNNKNYILDPTNDLFLLYKNRRIVLANDSEERMKYYLLSWLRSSIFGINNQGVNIRSFMKQITLPSISFEEYVSLYRDAVAKLEGNSAGLGLFYYNTDYMMDSINAITDRQDQVLKRLIPFIPKKKDNNSLT